MALTIKPPLWLNYLCFPCDNPTCQPLPLRPTFHFHGHSAERSLHDALCVLTETVKETRVICGGGCTEMLMAHAIDLQVGVVVL